MEWFQEHLWQAWLSLAVFFALLELMSMDLVLIMLAAGALLGMTAALVGLGWPIQVLAAVLGSLAMLAVVRPQLAKRLHGGPELQLGTSKLVGAHGVAETELGAHGEGRIKLDGEIWSARTYDETTTIAAGEQVEVVEIRGATAIVLHVPRLT